MKKNIIISMLSLVLVFALVLFASGCEKKNNKIYNYSVEIPTTNISSIEYKIEKDAGPRYVESNYRTLTNDEKDNFINSLSNNNFRFKYSKYDTSQYKGIYYNTFIIHYENGDKINFDKVHIEKVDSKGNSLYSKMIDPFECEIEKGMFEK